MGQSISLVRGSTSIASSSGIFTTLVTAPAGNATRVIFGGLSFVGDINNSGSNFAALINHVTSSGVHSPVFYTKLTSMTYKLISPIFVDGAANSCYDFSNNRPSVIQAISVTQSDTSFSTASSSFNMSTGSTNQIGNNIKNYWIGPGDTLQLSLNSFGVFTTMTVNYMFICITDT